MNLDPQNQAILFALLHGGSPQGNQSLMPILQGLGAQQEWLRNATPAQTLNASNSGLLTARVK